MEVSLKCQFCTLDFKSAYKMIPHVYFGHRKKISRQVRDQRSIFLKCPAPSCDFSHSTPVEDARPEIIFPTLAEMFLVVEDHIVTEHTKENKLVECPYCSLPLTNCVYWVHLEAHMTSTSSPATPVSKPASATPATPETPIAAPPASSEAPPAHPPVAEEAGKEEAQSMPLESIESKSTDSQDLKVTGNAIKESNIEEQGISDVSKGTRSGKIARSKILRDIEEIDKKIALKLKEEEEAKMIKMEEELKDSKQEPPENETSAEMVTSDNKECSREEESEIQIKVEKHIDENIQQNYQIKEKPVPSAQVTVTDSEIKEERKEVAVPEDNEEKSETLKPRSREISGDSDPGNRRRSISGEKRRTRTSVWNKDQQNSAAIKIQGITSVEVKSKPVLTEEMERNIIYGNFKMKDTASRDDKRIAVKREIENLFKEEEEKKRRINEEKRKAEEKEREKIRLVEERRRREREKLKEEKKRNKQRRKETKEEVEAEFEEEGFTENVELETEDNSNQHLSSAASPVRTRSKSPDQYQKIQLEISKMFKESEAATRAEKRPLDRDSQSPEAVANKIARTAPPPVVSYTVEEDEEEDEDDELEIMMREFQERQTTSTQQKNLREESVTTGSLSLIQSSYNSEMKEEPTPPSVADVDLETSPILSPMISLRCNFCLEEEGSSAVYTSVYQLLTHVFLAHRKKIVSAARKSGELSLTCPLNCGFVTPASSEGRSIDYFNSELAVHLNLLCDHMRAQHTGEDQLLHCPDSGLRLELDQVWAWQHLANHTDSRRQYCKVCNTFPFRNEAHRCTGQQDNNHVEAEQGKLEQTEREKEDRQAEEVLRQEVATILAQSLERDHGTYEDGEEEEEEKIALLEMFIELATIDEDASKTFSCLEVGAKSYPVDTELYFTKGGQVKLLGSVMIEEEQFQEYGETTKELFGNLTTRVRHHMQQL